MLWRGPPRKRAGLSRKKERYHQEYRGKSLPSATCEPHMVHRSERCSTVGE